MFNTLKNGHRKRVYSKLAEKSYMHDYEVVEMMLFLIFKRKDTKDIAKILLNKFGSIANVLNAPKHDLLEIHGIGESTYNAFSIIKAVINAYNKERIQKTDILRCYDDVLKYLQSNMNYLKYEELRILFLNNANHLIKDEVMQNGTIDSINVDNRQIIQKCIEIGAKAIILVHNHPSNDPTPSKKDITTTRLIIESCAIFDIIVVDHIIVSANRSISFRNLGLL